MKIAKKLILFISAALLLGSLTVACSSGESSSNDSSASGGEEGGGTTEMKIATASTSGAFYPIGGVMASILSENMEDYNFTAESTGGSEENARLIDTEKVDIGFFGSDTAYNAYNGKEAFDGNPIDKLSAMARVYVNPFHVVTLADKDIDTIADLEGKTVAVGAPGSGTSNKAEMLLREHDLIIDENVKGEYLGFKEGSEGLIDGIVDAVIISVGIPSGNVQELSASHDIKLVSFTEEKTKEISEKFPFFNPETIPAGAYDGIDEDVLTMGAPNEILVDSNLDEEFVYDMTKILFDTKFEEFQGAHSAMEDVTQEILPQGTVPLHPGAEKFYKEIGVLE